MNPQYVGTIHKRHRVECYCAVAGLIGRYAESFPYHRFPGKAGKQRRTENPELSQIGKQPIVLLHRLGEPESGIDYHIGHSGLA